MSAFLPAFTEMSTDKLIASVYKYVTFKSAASQMKEIAADVATVIEIVGRCVDWWAKIKMASENLQASVLKEGLRLQSLLPEDHVDGWKTLGDKFALYIYKVSSSHKLPH